MSPQADLLTFLQVVPVCNHDASLETLGIIFSQGNCEQVVIVNSQYQPLGMISLRRFLPYLLNQIPVSPPTQTQASVGEVFQAIIEPVIGIPSHLKPTRVLALFTISEFSNRAESDSNSKHILSFSESGWGIYRIN
ncbi:MAG: hypothetical protein RSE13_13970 [Planktothrix sp. GU0601_MAG3]|nr:MAG: hypothetical protein RSE13_13970 [Planktothrix sp. GU0601_MAG3]